MRIDPKDLPAGADTVNWGESPIGILYDEAKAPFLVELNRKEGAGSLAAQEIDEFIAALREVKKSPRKCNQVIQHLEQTRFMVACQLPIAEFDDDGFHALDVFLAYFLVHSGGMVQADGQGFYEMGELMVELEE